ncbi:hypothetical protein GCM10017779_64210 [Streptomyces capillispiralis]|nr:hypothetical protein GCM10017779_64210 [Streptomyces capillispiralis]
MLRRLGTVEGFLDTVRGDEKQHRELLPPPVRPAEAQGIADDVARVRWAHHFRRPRALVGRAELARGARALAQWAARTGVDRHAIVRLVRLRPVDVGAVHASVGTAPVRWVGR